MREEGKGDSKLNNTHVNLNKEAWQALRTSSDQSSEPCAVAQCLTKKQGWQRSWTVSWVLRD